MGDEPPKTNITWSANENFLQDFSAYFATAQKLFLMCRKDNRIVLDLFFHIHQLYIMEKPYLDGDEGEVKTQAGGLKAAHDFIQHQTEIYSRSRDSYRRDNFDRIYRMLDLFFIELVDIAVQKKFFPMAQRARNLEDVKHAMRSQ